MVNVNNMLSKIYTSVTRITLGSPVPIQDSYTKTNSGTDRKGE